LFAHAILLFAQLVGQVFCAPFCHGLCHDMKKCLMNILKDLIGISMEIL
jgi:hypothetical protein